MASFAVNEKIGRYVIKERIGRGGMAEVYRGYDANLERDVAIKVMYAYLSDDALFRERFEREAKIIATFNHPHIVRIYDFERLERPNDCVYYMVMPYLPGGTLRERLLTLTQENRLMPYTEVHAIIRGIGDALGYAHKRGMVHRDVKPANVLFDENGHVILTDFGIARWASGNGLTQEGTTVGTPTYMSPEQAESGNVDGRSDIYSLGVILYELLTLHAPFEDDGSLSIILKHLHEPPPSITKFVHTTNRSLDAVIQKALAKDENQRYQTTEEFLADLSQAFSEPTVELPRIKSDALPAQSVPTKNLTGAQTTTLQPQRTLQMVTQQITQVVTRSPLGLLIVGLALIGLMTVIGMLNNPSQETPQVQNTPVIQSMTGRETSGVQSMTGPLYFSSTFDDASNASRYWPMGNDSFVTRELTDDGFYRFSNKRPDTAMTTIAAMGTMYDNASMMFQATLEEGSAAASGYGIIFRYVDENNYNVFAIDGMRRYSIWALENGTWRELRGESEEWTVSDIINPLGQANIIAVDNSGNTFMGYVNNVKIVEVQYDGAPRGGIGVYLASTPNGTASLLIDTFVVTRFIPAMTAPESLN